MAAIRIPSGSSSRSASITSAPRRSACRSRGSRRRKPRWRRSVDLPVTVYVYRNGETQVTDRIDPKWVDPASGVTSWVDITQPTVDEGEKILRQTFQFHPLSVEDALSDIHYPKIESY